MTNITHAGLVLPQASCNLLAYYHSSCYLYILYEINYTSFPDVFDVPAEGGKFLIKQTYNNDYFLTHCEASIRYVDSNGKITVSYDSIQSHDTTFVYGNGKVHSYSDRFYNSWFELKKENKHEISLVVTPNNTGGKREIVVGVRDILFEGWPQKIMIYQPAY